MSYRPKQGDVVMANGWPAVVLENARSDKPLTPVLSAVFGWEVDYGSVYLRDIQPVSEFVALSALESDRVDRFKAVLNAEKQKAEKKAAAKLRKELKGK